MSRLPNPNKFCFYLEEQWYTAHIVRPLGLPAYTQVTRGTARQVTSHVSAMGTARSNIVNVITSGKICMQPQQQYVHVKQRSPCFGRIFSSLCMNACSGLFASCSGSTCMMTQAFRQCL